MAAEWRMREGEKEMARKVCDRVYETLDDFIEETQEIRAPWSHLSLGVLSDLRNRLSKGLPFDPPEVPA